MAAKIVRQVRAQVVYRGLTRAAKALGVSRPHLSYVLHGKRKPSARLAARLRRMGFEVADGAAARPVGRKQEVEGRKSKAEGGAE